MLVRRLINERRRRNNTETLAYESENALRLMRRNSFTMWRTAMNRIRAGMYIHDQALQPTVGAWVSLGEVFGINVDSIANDEHVEITRAFPPLSRCHWKECLCSIFEPAHSLRICKRCCRVAYCGTKCQEK